MEPNPTADLVSVAREYLAEVVRISKTSSNLKGTYQKTLKDAAKQTLGIVEVLRTKADRTPEENSSAEMKRLREEQEKLRRSVEKIRASGGGMRHSGDREKKSGSKPKLT